MNPLRQPDNLRNKANKLASKGFKGKKYKFESLFLEQMKAERLPPLRKIKKKRPFTIFWDSDETKKLIKAVALYGRDWITIQHIVNLNRTV